MGEQFLGRQAKVRCGFSHKHGDRILKLFSLLLQQDYLRPRGIQQGLFFGNIQPGSHAALMTRIHQLQALLQRLHGAAQNTELGIELAQREIISRELRGNHQPHIFQVCRARLIGGLRRLEASPTPSKQVHFVSGGEGQNDIGLGNRRIDREVAIRRTISGDALALCVGSSGKSGELGSDLNRR